MNNDTATLERTNSIEHHADVDIENFHRKFSEKLTRQKVQDLKDTEQAESTPSLIVAANILSRTPSPEIINLIYKRILSKEITGDATDFHNIAVEFSRKNRPGQAVDICEIGLEAWKQDIDLNADALTYALDSGDIKRAEILAEKLQTNCPDRAIWNWRGFSFLFEFYFQTQPEQRKEKIEELLEDYKKHLPFEEKAYSCEAQYYTQMGESKKAIDTLEEAINNLKAPQCALRLSDIYFNRADYRNAIRTATLGIAYAADPQPSIRTAYLILLRAMSKDSLFLKGEEYSSDDVDQIIAEYNLAKKYVTSKEELLVEQRIDILSTYK